jgi:hypothetical protein
VQTVVPLSATASYNTKLLALADAHGWAKAEHFLVIYLVAIFLLVPGEEYLGADHTKRGEDQQRGRDLIQN